MAEFISSNKNISNPQGNTGHLYTMILVSILIAVVTLSVYWNVIGFSFIRLDDSAYVTDNLFVKKGISLDGIKWAFSEVYVDYWHPLTWLSHMSDIQLFGLNPGMHHLTNLVFHILNAILLFIVLDRMTGAVLKSTAVAVFFALHPLHVESVAWISERKDVLSAFFWMLTMLSYHWYILKRTILRYLTVVTPFILGLMSKPMLVTLPFVLLLLDFWPLNRFNSDWENVHERNPSFLNTFRSSNRRHLLSILILEKIPLIMLGMVSCVITVYGQKSVGAMRDLATIELSSRVSNAITAYITYLGKMLWPTHLAIFYPYPNSIQPLWVLLCAIVLLSITVCGFLYAKKSPYLIVGWFWYLGTLMPVIGIIQVGDQLMADRYTYIPLIGIFLIVVWGFTDFVAKWRYKKVFLGGSSAIIFALLIISTWLQIGFWKNNEALFSHAVTVTENNYLAHGILGSVFIAKGDVNVGIKEYYEAIRINPYYYLAYFRLGEVFTRRKEYDKAIEYYSKGLEIKPEDILARNYLGNLFAKLGRTDDAINQYNESLRKVPHQSVVYNNLGNTYVLKGDIEKAIGCYQYAINEKHDYYDAIKNLKNALTIKKVQELLKSDPQNFTLYTKLGNIYYQLGVYDEAVAQYQKAISIQPNFSQAMNGLMIIYSRRQEYDKAISILKNLKLIQPDNPEVYYNIACLYAKQNMIDKSIDWMKQAIKKGFHDWDLIKNDPDLANIRNTAYLNELIKIH